MDGREVQDKMDISRGRREELKMGGRNENSCCSTLALYLALSNSMSCHVMLWHVMSCYVILCHDISYHVAEK